jgi:hypothetical protein
VKLAFLDLLKNFSAFLQKDSSFNSNLARELPLQNYFSTEEFKDRVQLPSRQLVGKHYSNPTNKNYNAKKTDPVAELFCCIDYKKHCFNQNHKLEEFLWQPQFNATTCIPCTTHI